MKKYDISIVISSISPEKWLTLCSQIVKSCGKYSFEIIAIGPNFPPASFENVVNFRYVRDFGCPSRCIQLSATIAEGEFFTWIADDSIVEEGAIEAAVDLLMTKNHKDLINMLYSEGKGHTGTQHEDLSYWTAGGHPSLHLKNINREWKLTLFGLYRLEYFKELGGVDCRFEHINMNTHDFAFRAQRNGSVVYNSPTRCYKLDHDWNPNSPVQKAYPANDLPLFQYIYNTDIERPIKINLDNWQEVPSVWPRKYLQ
jgi:hypothetical protein